MCNMHVCRMKVDHERETGLEVHQVKINALPWPMLNQKMHTRHHYLIPILTPSSRCCSRNGALLFGKRHRDPQTEALPERQNSDHIKWRVYNLVRNTKASHLFKNFWPYLTPHALCIGFHKAILKMHPRAMAFLFQSDNKISVYSFQYEIGHEFASVIAWDSITPANCLKIMDSVVTLIIYVLINLSWKW